LLLVIVASAWLRFWQLGQLPPGLYRDEATNGLDALDVLHGNREGESPFYFTANNGREPSYIYLTVISIAALGRSAFSVRLAAAITGTLTTWITYKLFALWFNRRIGLLGAWIWATTFWPIHVSRIGLRPVTLPALLTLGLFLGTSAYRRERELSDAGQGPDRRVIGLWLVSGIIYGLTFYTYLAVRFTPIFLAMAVVYLILTGRRIRIWPGPILFVVGAVLTITPLAAVAWAQPELLFDRLSQVSILNREAAGGALPSALLENTAKAVGAFLVKGDRIVRHNLPGRPIFDLFMAGPFIIGLLWSLRNWRRPAPMTLLLWSGVMLGPTILAEDSPHFLRAIGILPAVLAFPALGLSWIWTWTKLPSRGRRGLVLFLLAASLVVTVRDYFFTYPGRPLTDYWFEAAARELADNVNNDIENKTVYVDRRFHDSWPSIPFLVEPSPLLNYYRPAQFAGNLLELPAGVYAWPYEDLSTIAVKVAASAGREASSLIKGSSLVLLSAQTGGLAQGDLEPEPYPLYIRYTLERSTGRPTLANFGDMVMLRGAEVSVENERRLEIELLWSAAAKLDESLVAFVHVSGQDGLVGQSDSKPSQGNWPTEYWPVGVLVRDRHTIDLDQAYNNSDHEITVGLFEQSSRERLPLLDARGLVLGDVWTISS